MPLKTRRYKLNFFSVEGHTSNPLLVKEDTRGCAPEFSHFADTDVFYRQVATRPGTAPLVIGGSGQTVGLCAFRFVLAARLIRKMTVCAGFRFTKIY